MSYTLPARPLGKLRWLALFLVAFGVVFASIPATGLFRSLKSIPAGKAAAGDFGFAVFLVPFVVTGLVPLGLGLLVLFGRCRVEWHQKRLSVLDYVGPVRWRRRLQKSRILKLTVSSGGAKINGQPVTTGPLAELGALAAEFEEGRPRLVAIGYPRDWLEALAEDLSARVHATASTIAAPVVEAVNLDQSRPEPVEVVPKPADSRVRVEPRPDGVLLVVPPAGLRKGSKGLFGFAILWCLIVAVITTAIAAASAKNVRGKPFVGWALIGVFWLVGLSMLAGAVNMARRRAMLLVENGRLKVAQIGIFGAKRWDWNRENIAAIRADTSGLEVNNAPVIELQIHPVNGKKTGFFAGRDQEELRWMASELRRALKVPATTK
ncbi:MAG TPA: hypothetical protein VKA81_05950 [Verrucomicrobiae bacterium]|nr:hypothetical protein [Verrucomicrobiae bacterium]